ncbi:MAG: hypothetical protein HY718_02660 [Planctomycetes bacterium]|nr:hypothetical protein [Planctomycetota bacterium]
MRVDILRLTPLACGSRRRLPATSVLCALLAFAGPPPTLAQLDARSTSYRPSITGPSTELQRNFGRVGGYLAAGGSPGLNNRRNLRGATADLAGSMGRYRNRQNIRRPGLGYSDSYSPYEAGNRMLASGSAGLLRGVRGGGAYNLFPGAGLVSGDPSKELLTAMRLTSWKQQTGVVDTLSINSRLISGADYLNWMPRGAGLSGAASGGADTAALYEPVVAAPQEDQGAGASQPKQTLQQLVSNHLVAMRQSYLDRGWGAFRDGEYQAALRLFSMAEYASLDVPEDRAYIKLVLVYAGIAAGQYAQATNSLMWLLDQDPNTGRYRHAAALNRIFEENDVPTVGEMYDVPGRTGAVDPDYHRHNQLVESGVAQNPQLPQTRALLAMVEWGRGRRQNAEFEASKITDPSIKLSRLAGLFREANLSAGTGAGTGAGGIGAGVPSRAGVPAAAGTQPGF